MKNIKKYVFTAVFAAVLLTPIFLFNKDSDAHESLYFDWTALSEYDIRDKSTAKIYYRENTKITVKSYSKKPSREGKDFRNYDTFELDEGGTFVALVEDSTAADRYGNPVDVIWTVNNVDYWDNVSDPTTHEEITDRGFSISKRTTICGSDSASPTVENCTNSEATLGTGDPIMFWLNANYANADFTVQYIKKGTFENPEPVSMDKIKYMVFDFDVPRQVEGAQWFGGDEGIAIRSTNVGKTTYYYNKNRPTGYQGPDMYEESNGLAIRTNGTTQDALFNGIHLATSCLGEAENFRNSSYTFTYSSTTAGVTVFFGSPVSYTAMDPEKSINEVGTKNNRVTTGESFNYIISQYIPNNYSSDNEALAFSSLYAYARSIAIDSGTNPFMGPKRAYRDYYISDIMDENYEIVDPALIKVYRDDADVTNEFEADYFEDTREVRITAKDSFHASEEFYDANYKFVIPVTLKKSVDKKQIENTAKSKIIYSVSSQELTSNAVTTDIYHKVTVKHLEKETGKELADTTTTNYDHGAEYSTEKASGLPKGYQLVATPDNAKGTVTKDITVIYYYSITKNPSTLDQDMIPFIAAFAGAGVAIASLVFFVAKRR